MTSPEEVLQLIRERIASINRTHVYYALRRYKYRPIREPTLDIVVFCLAIDSLGLPITYDLIQSLRPHVTSPKCNYSSLHNLGDKNILVLRRERQRILRWLIHPEFKRILSGED